MAEDSAPVSRRFTRRRVLQAGALAGLTAAGGKLAVSRSSTGEPAPPAAPAGPTDRPAPLRPTGDPPSSPVPEGRPWSDPATWNGQVPGPGDVAVLSFPVHLDIDARVRGVQIDDGGALVFDPGASRSLDSTGNVVVRGRLVMHPARPDVFHRLSFVGIDETSFAGGGKDVLDSDVGLWVVGAGVLDVAGSPKLGWTRTVGAVAKGSKAIELEQDPAGWQVGDEIAITPTASPATEAHSRGYDVRRVTAVSGRSVSLDEPTGNEHPAVTVWGDTVQRPEVLNLTRNARIEGTPTGRSHVFMRSTVAQSLGYLGLRHMGPRQSSGSETTFVPGRYAVHIHDVQDASRGSLAEGLVARECGSHAFVTHNSHGVVWRECITHDTMADPYWWDPLDKDKGIPALPSDDVAYERCIASFVRSNKPKDLRLSAFFLGAGERNTARECVAVGVQGIDEASGFLWPAQSEGSWMFEDCVGHNNAVHGIFVWQNTGRAHVVTRFTGYHNGGSGIFHGAYLNRYEYRSGVLYANGDAALTVRALSKASDGTLRFIDLRCDAAGLSDFAVVVPEHVQASGGPTVLTGCTFRGFKEAAVGVVGEGANPHILDLVDNAYEGNPFNLRSTIPPASVIRVQDPARGSISLRRADQPGTLSTDWNASVNPIPRFGS